MYTHTYVDLGLGQLIYLGRPHTGVLTYLLTGVFKVGSARDETYSGDRGGLKVYFLKIWMFSVVTCISHDAGLQW